MNLANIEYLLGTEAFRDIGDRTHDVHLPAHHALQTSGPQADTDL